MFDTTQRSKSDYDPVLKLAMEEIKPILRKHGLMAFVALASEMHGEHLLEIPDASWCGLAVENQDDGSFGLRVRIRFKEDPQGHKASATVGALQMLSLTLGQFFMVFDSTLKATLKELKRQGAKMDYNLPKFTPDRGG